MKTVLVRPILYHSGSHSIALFKVFKSVEKAEAWARKVILAQWEDNFSNYVRHPDDFHIGFEELELGD